MTSTLLRIKSLASLQHVNKLYTTRTNRTVHIETKLHIIVETYERLGRITRERKI